MQRFAHGVIVLAKLFRPAALTFADATACGIRGYPPP